MGKGLPPLVMLRVRHSNQSGKELSDTVSDHQLPGDETSDVSFEGFPGPQTCPEALLSRSRFLVLFNQLHCGVSY